MPCIFNLKPKDRDCRYCTATICDEREPKSVETYITTNLLQVEPVSEELEKAAGNYAFTMSGEDEVSKYYAFLAGAKWQKQKDQKK